MNRFAWRCGVLCLLCLIVPAVSAAIDPNAEIVTVRKDCNGADNCFELLDDALTWTWTTRNPTVTSKLLVDIGPGIYNEQVYCPDGRGHVTFRGAGRDATSIRGAANDVAAATFQNCDEIEVMDLAIENNDWGVEWAGGGSSTWTDVDIVGLPGGTSTIGWIDDIVQGQEDDIALHYFFGCRVHATGRQNNPYPAAAYWASASETWFFGGEILWEVSENGGAGAALLINAGGDFHAFGTVIRAVATGTGLTGDITGVEVNDAAVVGNNAGEPSVFHMHGGIINVNANGNSLTGYGLKVLGANSTAHSPDTAFNVTGSFVFRVLVSGGAAMAPFQWPAATQPPSFGAFYSANGQDMFVETDCGSNGDCDGGGSEPHLMINTTSCTGFWFDSVTGRCRNDVQ